MKSYEELKNIAREYVREKEGEGIYVNEPVFRYDNGEFYLGYVVLEFTVDSKYLKKPTKWFTQDIETGEITNYYEECDFLDVSIPDKIINCSSSIVFDDNNFVILSFANWKNKIKEELQERFNNTNDLLHKMPVLKLDDELISPRDYLMANLDDCLEKMREVVLSSGGNIGEYLDLYTKSVFDEIVKDYFNEGKLNKEKIKEYLNVINYSWPDYLEITNSTNNIDGVIDDDFMNSLIAMRNEKLNKIEKI